MSQSSYFISSCVQRWWNETDDLMAGFSQTVNTLTDESSHVSVHIREVHEQSSRESNININAGLCTQNVCRVCGDGQTEHWVVHPQRGSVGNGLSEEFNVLLGIFFKWIWTPGFKLHLQESSWPTSLGGSVSPGWASPSPAAGFLSSAPAGPRPRPPAPAAADLHSKTTEHHWVLNRALIRELMHCRLCFHIN